MSGNNQHRQSTPDRVSAELLGGQPRYSARDLAEHANCDLEQVHSYWLAMGLPAPDDDVHHFTQLDLDRFSQWITQVRDSGITQETAESLLRAYSYTGDRVALWQFEALTRDYMSRYRLDDTSARLVALDRISDFLPMLEAQMTYTWRRELENLLRNTSEEVGARGRDDPNVYPLVRALGFVDMVSYTSTSSQLTASELAALVTRFEQVSRNLVTAHGCRVVKTIGDAVLFIGNDLLQVAELACDLVQQMGKDQQLLPVRASLVSGRVLSRSGDVFGPPVNLAARIVDVARNGQVLTDTTTAENLEHQIVGDVRLDPAGEYELAGIGAVKLWQLRCGV